MVASEGEQDDQDKELMAELTKGLSVSSSLGQAATKGPMAQQPSLRGSGGQSREAAPKKKTSDSGREILCRTRGSLSS